MNKDNLKSTPRTHWEALESMSDEEIDYSDIPPLTEDFFTNATLKIPVSKVEHFVELDADVLQWLQSHN